MSIINLMSVYTHSCFYPLWTCIMLFYFILWSFAIATFYLPQANEDLFCGCVLTEPEVWPLQYQCVITGWFLVAIWENSATYWSGELSRVIIHREYNLFTTLCFCLACMTSQLLFFFFFSHDIIELPYCSKQSIEECQIDRKSRHFSM